MPEVSQFVTYDAKGVNVWNVNNPPTVINQLSNCSNVDNISISNNGKYLAVVCIDSMKIFQIPNFNTFVHDVKVPEATVKFSPNANFIACGFSQVHNNKNLRIYNVVSGDLTAELVDAKRELIHWSEDESLSFRMIGSELLFYENNNYNSCSKKYSQKIASYSFATNKSNKCNYVVTFVKGAKGGPSSIKIHKYPMFDNTIASKSLFKIDTASFKWNPKGDALLIMASNDVDTTGSSYYGQTTLHFMDLKGNSCLISGKKEGSFHDCQWLPNNEGFIAVYGKMPASVTLFNNKGDVAFEFKESVVNSIHINPFGNLVAFGGFGNLSGNVHVWNVKTKTLISEFNARDTTHFTWTTDGLHIITSTQFERLRVENGFKLWNYLGNLLHTEDMKKENSTPLHCLLAISNGNFEEPQIQSNIKGKLFSDVPKAVYVPPSLQTREQQLKMNKFKKQLTSNSNPEVSSGLSVKEKKIKNLSKKLEQIELLKKSLADGKQLEKNQLEKIDKETDIVNEINMLKLEA